jgi:hypothetical protein
MSLMERTLERTWQWSLSLLEAQRHWLVALIIAIWMLSWAMAFGDAMGLL